MHGAAPIDNHSSGYLGKPSEKVSPKKVLITQQWSNMYRARN